VDLKNLVIVRDPQMAGVERMPAADVQPNTLFLAKNRKAEFVGLTVVDQGLKRSAEAG
jgi:hypothetical protein